MMKESKINRRDALKRSGLFVGGTLSIAGLATLFQGCEVPMDPDWAPAFFSEDEATTLGHLAETIIPKTDTPGAMDAKVHRYLDVMASEVLPKAESDTFRAGLTRFMAKCDAEFGAAFKDLSAEKKVAAVQSIAEDSGQDGDFFKGLRQAVIVGFFTSQPGATEVLKFDPIPGEYLSCIPLEEVGGTWAL
ncbi:MAG: gluconate 2-dehydrogenase subunit 3 family protein [Saprospiraceae bacterium]|nr:gluconate 2-dehydrogenase subunit 3 family protein [Saprospiraceae bacterium]